MGESAFDEQVAFARVCHAGSLAPRCCGQCGRRQPQLVRQWLAGLGWQRSRRDSSDGCAHSFPCHFYLPIRARSGAGKMHCYGTFSTSGLPNTAHPDTLQDNLFLALLSASFWHLLHTSSRSFAILSLKMKTAPSSWPVTARGIGLVEGSLLTFHRTCSLCRSHTQLYQYCHMHFTCTLPQDHAASFPLRMCTAVIERGKTFTTLPEVCTRFRCKRNDASRGRHPINNAQTAGSGLK